MWAMWGQPAPGQAKQTLFSLVAVPAGQTETPVSSEDPLGGEGGRVPPHTPPGAYAPRGGIRAHVFARDPPPPSRATLGSLRHDEPDAIGRARLDALNKTPGLGEFEHAARLGV